MTSPIRRFFRRTALSENRPDAGFTLVEIMIAATVFAIGVLALASMQITSVRGNATSASVTDATLLGINQIEQLMETDYDTGLTAGTTTSTVQKTTYPASNYTMTQTITDNDVINNTKTVRITVQWMYNGQQKEVVIHHVIPRVI